MWIALLIIAALGILACWYGPAPAPWPKNQGINTLELIELGGVKQWVSIRGSDVSHPVLLFLHGGPGSANLAKLRVQSPELEQHFIVVNWDQRGAGKNANASDLTISQLRQDTHQLIEYLRGRFGGKKIYLMGFSWGTILGLWTALDYPDDIVAYIGVNQEANLIEAEKRSLDFVQQAARQANDTQAIKELADIDPAYRSHGWFAQLNRERTWLLHYNGVYRKTNSYTHEIFMMLQASEYSFIDVCFWPYRSSQSLQTLWPEVMTVDFFTAAPQLDVPVYFLAGRYDYNAPSVVTQAYYDQLVAPKGKHLIWFEDSAHDIFYDQPDVLVETLIKIKGDQE